MDIQEHSMTVQASKNPGVAIACVEYTAKVYDDDGRTLLADFTGDNSIEFLFRVRGFNVAQHRRLAEEIGQMILAIRVRR
jgi:hypothetical protein